MSWTRTAGRCAPWHSTLQHPEDLEATEPTTLQLLRVVLRLYIPLSCGHQNPTPERVSLLTWDQNVLPSAPFFTVANPTPFTHRRPFSSAATLLALLARSVVSNPEKRASGLQIFDTVLQPSACRRPLTVLLESR